MDILICIDDTDNLESRGTGELAELIAKEIEKKNWGRCSVITRHQLLLHDDIPYTSHNSSMCFHCKLNKSIPLNTVIEFSADFLESESAEGSDPGLAVAETATLSSPAAVIEFGRSAKRDVLTQEAAYAFAREHGIHLSEHGGTGQGVIGALAGIGLRLTGNDGRIKGRLNLGATDELITVEEILRHPQIDAVQNMEHAPIAIDQLVRLGEKIKTVWLNHQNVLLVCDAEDGHWKTCGKQQLRKF